MTVALYRRGLRLIAVAVLTALSVASPPPAHASNDPRHPGICGPNDRPYGCGQILVILNRGTSASIGTVLQRHGGDPEHDLAGDFQAASNILDQDQPSDGTAVTVYIVLTDVDAEEQAAIDYSADPDVFAASVDRHTIGFPSPNTAVLAPSHVDMTALAVTAAGLALLGAAMLLAHDVRRAQGD